MRGKTISGASLVLLAAALLVSSAHPQEGSAPLRFGRLELTYVPPVTEGDARRLGEVLSRLVGEKRRELIELSRRDGQWRLQVRLLEREKVDALAIDAFRFTARILSTEVFRNEPVKVVLSDPLEQNVIALPAVKGYGRGVLIGEQKLYYAPGLDEERARALGAILRRWDHFPLTYLEKGEKRWEVNLMVLPGQPLEEAVAVPPDLLASLLSAVIFGGEETMVHYTDYELRSLLSSKGRANARRTLLVQRGVLELGEGVSEETARKFGEYLAALGFLDTRLAFLRLTGENGPWRVYFPVQSSGEELTKNLESLQQWVEVMSDQVFEGRETELHLCRLDVETLELKSLEVLHSPPRKALSPPLESSLPSP